MLIHSSDHRVSKELGLRGAHYSIRRGKGPLEDASSECFTIKLRKHKLSMPNNGNGRKVGSIL